MALKLNERYPGRFVNPSGEYPLGSFKNRTTPTSKDGSYLEKDWANDKEGFFQSLIYSAGLVANGLVDKVGASQYFDALSAVIKLTSIPWSKVTNRPTTVSGYGITDAMPVAGGPYYPSFNGMRIAAESGGYGAIGGYQGWGSNGSGTYQFINNKGGGSTGGFLFTHSDASGNLTNAMRYTPDGRLAVAVELYVPAIVSNTSAPTQGAGYSGTYLANCAFVANAIAAIPKNTATFTANSYSKNADTGEILQYKEVLIGDIPAGGATIDVTWPFAFPNAFHNVVSVTLKSADATVRHITTAYTSMGTVNGCRLQVDEANQSVQPASLTAVITARGR